MIELILGGARSGKSALAELRARDSGMSVTCVVTGEARDAEMASRITHHQQQRDTNWRVREAPLYLAATLQQEAATQYCLLVDCLTLWLNNLLCAANPDIADHGNTPLDLDLLRTETSRLLEVLPQLPGRIILISNEVGLGVVPMGSLTRAFVDEQGRLNQQLARLASHVTLVAAGLPLELKS